ncbi:uncharacterized protein [Aphelocoma coerulescens]|uniref:uncharacterized protein n=1 Tax=Aphelocoma coerulescens TaxID=39617 RepID=UPI003604CFB0
MAYSPNPRMAAVGSHPSFLQSRKFCDAAETPLAGPSRGASTGMRFPGCSRDAAPAEGLQAAGSGAWWEKAWIFHPAKAGTAGKRCQSCQLPARGHCERRAECPALLLSLPLSLLSPGSGAVPPHGLPALPIPARLQVPCLRENPGSRDQPQPRPAQRRRIRGSVCMKWNFTRFTGSESRRSTSNPPRLPGAWRRQGWVGMGLHPPGSGSRNSGPPPRPRRSREGTRGQRQGWESRGWRDGGEGERFQRRRAVDREGRQGAAHAALPRPHLAGLTKGPDGAARLRRFPSPGSAKFRGTERAAGTATFSLRRVWLWP